ncbi:MBL fold metallo-hydrolase [Streptomyces sp. NPDC005865]|uniref:MBL fold metallo-hydrolase n=1 Tax=Streptomyces sp. NPDC005865 TaxID=3155453 RepID=UPI0033D7A312
MTTTTAHAAAEDERERFQRPARMRTLRLGRTKLTYIPDGAVQLSPRRWFAASTEEDWAAHPEVLDATGYLVASIGGLLVEAEAEGEGEDGTDGDGAGALLIDAGFGPLTAPAQEGERIGAAHGGALLDSLAAAGHTPADIGTVAFTHLHPDHVGWAWHTAPGGDGPALGGAEYVLAEQEWSGRHSAGHEGLGDDILKTLEPRVRTVADGEEIRPGVRVRLLPGHTSGHTGYVISAGAKRVIAFGDVMHSPAQISHPQWSASPDLDGEAAAEARRALIAELAEPDTIGFGIHFADVPFGTVQRDGEGLRWVPYPTEVP